MKKEWHAMTGNTSQFWVAWHLSITIATASCTSEMISGSRSALCCHLNTNVGSLHMWCFQSSAFSLEKNPTLNSHLGDNTAHNLPDFILRQLFHSLRALMVCHVPLKGAKPQESVVVERVSLRSFAPLDGWIYRTLPVINLLDPKINIS